MIRNFLFLAIPISLIFLQASVATAQEKTKEVAEDWVHSMPVSLNGELPSSNLWKKGTERRVWHNSIPTSEALRKSWKPEVFFDDPLVIDLCNAIFKPDVAEMERLIAKGADVNQIGKDGVTPLYWAFHMNLDPRPFELLLEHGADPNVIVTYSSERQVKQAASSGYAVTNLVVRGLYNRQFKNVFEHGGNPNLVNKDLIFGIPAFRELWAEAPDAAERLQLLIDSGADLDLRHPENGTTFVLIYLGEHEHRNRLAHIALKAGANYQLLYKQVKHFPDQPAPYEGCYFRLIHYLAKAEPKVSRRPIEAQTQYRALVAWLEEHGESLAEAKVEIAQWARGNQPDLFREEYEKQLAHAREIQTKKNESETEKREPNSANEEPRSDAHN